MSVLSTQFLNSYRTRPVGWGFPSGPNHLGELVYRRTYRRGDEQWRDTVERVVLGAFELLERQCRGAGSSFSDDYARPFAEEMYERVFSFKFLPPGRGLWLMGTPFVRDKGAAGLNNCAFVSTKDLGTELSLPFEFLMDMSMLGVGVGFDVRGAGKARWQPQDRTGPVFAVTDDREGWVESTAVVIRWGLGVGPRPRFDYSAVRKAGEPIRGFGGVASGPEPLVRLHEALFELVGRRRGQLVSSRDIADVGNLVGVCVVAGNVRRTAEIIFGDPSDAEYLDLKDYEKNPERGAWGWTSNNSVFAEVGMDYGPCAARTRRNGEPGYAWLENMRAFGRMKDPADWRDRRVLGGNPCLEQSLEHYELCCLVENFPHHHETLDDFKRTLSVSWLYAKAVTTAMTHWEQTNEVIRRNRRVGSSMSGVVQALHRLGEGEFRRWCDEGYRHVSFVDELVSRWLRVNESVKKTSVKPSGTVSLLAGAKPGCHYDTYRCYLRRVRYSADHPDVGPLRRAGYRVEPSVVGYEDYPAMTRPVYDPKTVVVEFPVDADGDGLPSEQEVSLEHKVGVAVMMQHEWADNQVSCTATFLPAEGAASPASWPPTTRGSRASASSQSRPRRGTRRCPTRPSAARSTTAGWPTCGPSTGRPARPTPTPSGSATAAPAPCRSGREKNRRRGIDRMNDSVYIRVRERRRNPGPRPGPV
jgi:ribonucleoside-triphosphate reductase